jgi:5-methyltetrahydrofolate--homocysteine methyltransferase
MSYDSIQKAVTYGDIDVAENLVKQALETGLPPIDILNKGVVAGIITAGNLWKTNEFFMPEVILAAKAFKVAMAALEPHLGDHGERSSKTFVIGVVAGDVHDLGKSMVCAMLQPAGFKVVDLGVDVPTNRFIEAVEMYNPVIVGLGAYMTTTMMEMENIIKELEARNLRNRIKVMVGGAPVDQAFADAIGADAYGKDAIDAMEKAKALLEI